MSAIFGRERRHDLRDEITELSELNARLRDQLSRYREALTAIYAEHQPMTAWSRGNVRIELRCRRCQTDEHHTWKNDNHVPWPCPTLKHFVGVDSEKSGDRP